MSYSLVRGDLDPDMFIDLDMNDVAESLGGALAIELEWTRPDGTEVTVDLEVVDAAAGQVKRVWEDGDTEIVGTHTGRVVVTRSNGDRQHFPSDGSRFSWTVNV